MEFVSFLQSNVSITIIFAAIIGLVFGSFFNVVISRLPIMLHRAWDEESREFLNLPGEKSRESFNLFAPASQCPKCKAKIRFWQNIPLVSYLLLRGKCARCKNKISAMYPLVEAITAISGVWVLIHFGLNVKALFAIIFTWGLIVLSFIDLNEQILPDDITLSLLWIGLLTNCFSIFTPIKMAVIGAALAYAMLWSVATLFKFFRKKDGMGHGDFKLFACICAWLGVGALLNVLLVAVITALIISLCLLFSKKMNKDQPIPFGPFLAIGGWITMMYGSFIVQFINQVRF